MFYAKRLFIVLGALSTVSFMSANCGPECTCAVDNAAYKALEARMSRLEEALFPEDSSDMQNEGDRGIVSDKVESFIEALKKLRKDFDRKLRVVSNEVKLHTDDIKKIDEQFNSLCSMLGCPSILTSFGAGAHTVIDLVLSLYKRIEALEHLVKNNNA